MISLPCISSVIHICKSLSYQQAFLPSNPCFIGVDPWLLTSAFFVSFVPLVVHSRLATAKRSSTAPKRSSTLPNCSSDLPKPSSRAQLEPFVFDPIRANLSRQTPCEFSAEKSPSHLSPRQGKTQKLSTHAILALSSAILHTSSFPHLPAAKLTANQPFDEHL